MRRGRSRFWDDEKLKELETIFPHRTPAQLCRKYDKPYSEIVLAYEYRLQHKRMKITSRKQKKTRFTIYKPGYADGVHPSPYHASL